MEITEQTTTNTGASGESWSLSSEFAESDDVDLLVSFEGGAIPAIIYHFGLKPGLALENSEGLKLEEVDHIEAVLEMGPNVDNYKPGQEADIIIDLVTVRQFVIKPDYNEDGVPLNKGRLALEKESRFRMAYRGTPDEYPHGCRMEYRTERLLRDAHPCIKVMQQDLIDYKAGKKV